MDEIDKAILESTGKQASKSGARQVKTKVNPLVRSATTSIVRNIVGHVTRAILKALSSGGKKNSGRGLY